MQTTGRLNLVDHVTPWINSFVIVERKDKQGQAIIRICLNPTNLNKTITIESFYCRTPADVFHKLSHDKVFTTVDFFKGYWHIECYELQAS